MIDKRTLEFILADQQEEIEARAEEILCRRPEERKIDLKSTQAQAVIGIRRSGKSNFFVGLSIGPTIGMHAGITL